MKGYLALSFDSRKTHSFTLLQCSRDRAKNPSAEILGKSEWHGQKVTRKRGSSKGKKKVISLKVLENSRVQQPFYWTLAEVGLMP